MKIRVGTFNLFQFVEPPYAWYSKKDKFNKRQWFEKTTWIKNQILEMDCDIIGFQEVFSQDALKSLVHNLGFHYFETVDVAKLSTNNPQKYVSTIVAIASKHPITKIEDVEVHMPSVQKHDVVREDTEHFRFSRKHIKATVMLANKKELLVYVCHLKSNRLNEFEYVFHANDTLKHKKELVFKALDGKHATALKQRLCEASSLFFDIEKSKDKPTVLLCDLNDKEFSITIDALTNPRYHDESNMNELVLHDAHHHYSQVVHNPHPEFKATKRKSTSYFLGKGNVLDYIFIAKELTQQVTNYLVLDNHLQENKDGSLLQSDHAQVVCELTFT
ncbi:MAG: Endonuclease/exonuclease/phosphatase family protein [uncultured Sulfurovum sp.]|uniref:Endonuclease/exonuclease/phosphatase family protein n=1 Tax=uncultured Sulfurovum sp. TaxID=269237 RepID=A0A6S6U6B7_9BACT|nr:MAG: Endonuclease/exonuclease/phosphatase family protein [uncultured Sulfurovum sp.]